MVDSEGDGSHLELRAEIVITKEDSYKFAIPSLRGCV